MRGSAFIAFFGIATALSGALVGCGDDDADETEAKPAKVTKSGEGESCVRTDDCDTDLACFGGVCLESASGTGGTNGTGGSSTGGTAPTLGREGESCTKRADCNPPLGCFNQHCADTGSGEGGGGNTPVAGAVGETCVLSSDCESGLICRPGGSQASIGVCTPADSGVEPTGKVCGAECRTEADCCELPVELHGVLGVKSCAELEDVQPANCDATTLTAQEQAQCFALGAYCECGNNTWACPAGACVYTEPCSGDGLVPGGCATFSRTGISLFATCDSAESELCQPSPTDPLCTTDADCDTLMVSDDVADTCNAGECACVQSGCYRTCGEDLDCAVGLICDDTDHVCIPQGACMSDTTCKRVRGDYRATCTAGVCSVPCETDIDCNATLVSGGFAAVCNASHMCEALGCDNDNECPQRPGATNMVRTLCTTPEQAAGARTVNSAITD